MATNLLPRQQPVKTIGEINVWILQPDQSLSQGPDGACTAKLSYKCTWSKVDKFVPKPLQEHPTFPQLLLYEFTTVREPGDVGRFDLIYRGSVLKQAQLDLLAQEEAALSVSTEPIETNPYFAGNRNSIGDWPLSPPVTSAELGAINRALSAGTVYSSSNPKAVALFNRKLRGLDSYYRVGTTYRNTYVKLEAPVAEQYAVVGGIIPNADMQRVYPNSPVPGTGQNYLMPGLSWRKQGGIFTVTGEFQLSGRGGWDGLLYPEIIVA
jgi:hypothetical protein